VVVLSPGLALALALAPGPSAAPTHAIEGRVVMAAARPPARRPDASRLAPPPAAAPAAPSPAVVYLDPAPQGAFEDPGRDTASLDQRDETFVPHVLAVRAGTTVRFLNNDETYHNVFSLSPARRFDLGRYPRGEARTVRFDRPGVVRVFCEIHSHMNAWILVFAHGSFAVTRPDGGYRLPPVPPGRYTLVVWHEGRERVRRPVVVADQTARLDLELPEP